MRKRRKWFDPVAALPLLLCGACYGGASSDQADTDDATESGADASGSADDGSGDGDDGVPEGLECEGEVVDPGPNLVRRLTVDEYINTVQAVLGADIEEDARALLPAELRADGFTNTSSGLITTLEHIEAYDALAEVVVAQIPDFASFVITHAGCTDFTDDCQSHYVESLGREMFRRPLSTEEIDALVPVFSAAQEEGESFVVGAGLVVEAMLQSPPFLYRLEDETTGSGDVRVLGGYEMANRLSYLLWAGPPDEALLTAAGQDALASDDEIVAQVDRLLSDPRALDASLLFVGDWLNLNRLANLPRDLDRFPEWSTTISRAMADETAAFFESVAWDQNRPLTELFTAQETWLSPELAAHYGFEPAETDGVSQYDLTDVPERGGLLTQGSLLTIGGDNASMVARGLFLLETVLCGHLESPPPGVDTTVPPVEPGKSQRSYSQERTENPSCMGCHRQMEPIAWGLERFLADGSYATEDFFGNPLLEDGFVQLPGDDTEYPFETIPEMMEILGGSDEVEACFGAKGLQRSIARPLVPADDCALEQLQGRLADSSGTWRDLVVAVALSPEFRTIRVESAP